MDKASEVMEFQLSYFKSKKMTLLKCCTHMPAIWTTQQLPQDWKMSIFIPTPKKGNAKEYSNYRSITFISQSSKAMLKILQARLPQYMNWKLSDVQTGFRKDRGTRGQIANMCWILEKAREFQKKTSTSALLTMPKPLTVWITTNCGKFLTDGNTRLPYGSPEKSVCTSRSNSWN